MFFTSLLSSFSSPPTSPRGQLSDALPLGEQIGGTSGGAGFAPPLSFSGALHHSHPASPSPTSGSSLDFSVHPPLSCPLSPAFMPSTQLLLLRTGNSGQPPNSPGDVAPKGIRGQGSFLKRMFRCVGRVSRGGVRGVGRELWGQSLHKVECMLGPGRRMRGGSYQPSPRFFLSSCSLLGGLDDLGDASVHTDLTSQSSPALVVAQAGRRAAGSSASSYWHKGPCSP